MNRNDSNLPDAGLQYAFDCFRGATTLPLKDNLKNYMRETEITVIQATRNFADCLLPERHIRPPEERLAGAQD
jgi:hypothetical protein